MMYENGDKREAALLMNEDQGDSPVQPICRCNCGCKKLMTVCARCHQYTCRWCDKNCDHRVCDCEWVISPWDQGAAYPCTPLMLSLVTRPYLVPAGPLPVGVVRLLVDGGSSVNVLRYVQGMEAMNVRDANSKSIGVGNPDHPVICEYDCDIAVALQGHTKDDVVVSPEAEWTIASGMCLDILSEGIYLDKHGIVFDKATMTVRSLHDNMTAPMYRHGNLFYVHAMCDVREGSPVCMAVAAERGAKKALLWNARLGGMHSDALRAMPKLVNGMDTSIEDDGTEIVDTCKIDCTAVDHCQLRAVSRMKTDVHKGSLNEDKIASRNGERIIVDGWPMLHAPKIGTSENYLMLAVDEKSGMGFMRGKSHSR
eukprot:6545649-Prymnesium_polylepis.2